MTDNEKMRKTFESWYRKQCEPSCLVSYSPEDTAAIAASGLQGKLLFINSEVRA